MADETLRLRITADADAAEKELRDLDKLADRIDLDPKVDTKGMDNLADSAGRLPGPLGDAASLLSGGGGIAAGASLAATAVLGAVDAFADGASKAKALQTAVGGTVEESSRLLAVTEQVGLEYNDVVELVAESNKAIGENADEAERLGVELSGTPLERFTQLADQIYRIPDPLERSAAASKFFGEEGSKQLPALIARFGSVADAMKEIDDANVFTDDDAEEAKRYQNAIAGIKASFGEVANSIGRNAIPKIAAFLEKIDEMLDKVGGAERFIIGVDVTPSAVRDLINDMGGLEAQTGDTRKALEDMARDSGILSEFTDEAATSGRSLSDAFAEVVTEGSAVVGFYDELKTATDEARAANEELRDEMFTTADTTIEAGRKWSDLNDELGAYRTNTEKTRSDTERLEDAVFDYADAQVAAAGTTRDTTEGAKLYKDALRVAADLLGDDMTPELQNYIDTVLAVPDTAVTDIKGELDPTEFNEADRRADELDRRQVAVKITADVSRFVEAANRAVSNALGGRAQQSTAARYVWRNGRYVEVNP
jgi:hypothetical protein